MNEKDIAECHFVPISTLKKVVKSLQVSNHIADLRCKRNLVHIQLKQSDYRFERKNKSKMHVYQKAIRQAIYSHDWDCLAYLLKQSPIWEHSKSKAQELPLYMRALIILLMNHPSAKTQSLLNDFLHMVLACRSDEDKKAVYKIILSLPDKIYGRSEDS